MSTGPVTPGSAPTSGQLVFVAILAVLITLAGLAGYHFLAAHLKWVPSTPVAPVEPPKPAPKPFPSTRPFPATSLFRRLPYSA